MRKGEITRARILEEAARLAALRGLSTVTLGELADAVGLSKSGLFKHFESKEAMQRRVLQHALDRFREFVWEAAATLPPGRTRLEAIFERWLDWDEVENPEGGCPLIVATVELDDQPGPLRDLLHQRQWSWSRRLAEEMRALRRPAPDEEEARRAAFQMKSFILGFAEAKRLLGEADARRQAKAAFRALLDRAEQGLA